MYKTLQTYLQASKLLKHMCTNTKVIKNAEYINAWIKLKLFILLAPMK